MRGVLFAELTIFAYFNSVRIVLLILLTGIISLLAFCAGQSYCYSHLYNTSIFIKAQVVVYHGYSCLSTIFLQFRK